MPLYEYRCTACGERTEVLQRLADAPLARCPRCGGGMEKLISAPALQFKGTGWYVTDYGKKGSEGKAPANADGDATAAKKEESKADAKADAKTDAKADTKTVPKAVGS